MFLSAHSCHFADLTLTTWQVMAGQIHLTATLFPIFLSFPHSLSLRNQFQSFQCQLRCHLLCEAFFDTSLSSRNQLLPPQNTHNNLLALLFYIPMSPFHLQQLENRHLCSDHHPLFYYFTPKSRKGRERLKKGVREL